MALAAGGLVIVSAAVLFLLINGRIMAASGILGGLVKGAGRGNVAQRLMFLARLIAIPTGDLPLLVRAGILVGLSTGLAIG